MFEHLLFLVESSEDSMVTFEMAVVYVFIVALGLVSLFFELFHVALLHILLVQMLMQYLLFNLPILMLRRRRLYPLLHLLGRFLLP